MRYFAAILLLVFPALCFAADFPALTGRVVDNANIISAEAENSLTQMLAEHEAKTTNQVVVVTVPNLNGQPIEDFGVKLGRKWGIGQKGKNNGVLFIIAPNDREARIEVGYGLEGTLTDATSSQIIRNVVLPKFKNGQMETGVVDGTTAIISRLRGDNIIGSNSLRAEDKATDSVLVILLFTLIFGFFLIPLIYIVLYDVLLGISLVLAKLGIGFFKAFFLWVALTGFHKWMEKWFESSTHRGSGGGGFSSGGGFGGGSFSGGGGSFGGGGSSGKW